MNHIQKFIPVALLSLLITSVSLVSLSASEPEPSFFDEAEEHLPAAAPKLNTTEACLDWLAEKAPPCEVPTPGDSMNSNCVLCLTTVAQMPARHADIQEELRALQAEKDLIYAKIAEMNKELSTITTYVEELTTQITKKRKR